MTTGTIEAPALKQPEVEQVAKLRRRVLCYYDSKAGPFGAFVLDDAKTGERLFVEDEDTVIRLENVKVLLKEGIRDGCNPTGLLGFFEGDHVEGGGELISGLCPVWDGRRFVTRHWNNKKMLYESTPFDACKVFTRGLCGSVIQL